MFYILGGNSVAKNRSVGTKDLEKTPLHNQIFGYLQFFFTMEITV